MKQGIINGVHNGIIPQYNKIVTRGSIVAANNRRRRPVPGMLQWLRADQRITYNGLNASVWGDLSGNGFDVSQALAASQPLPTNSVINGHPALYFDGGDNMTNSFGATFAQPLTIFLVWKVTISAIMLCTSGIDAANHADIYTDTGAGGIVHLAGNVGDFWSPRPMPFTISTTAVFNGASSLVYENGILKTTGTIPSSNLTGTTIGSYYNNTYYFTGYVAEIIIYPRLLTVNEFTFNHNYLKERYAL